MPANAKSHTLSVTILHRHTQSMFTSVGNGSLTLATILAQLARESSEQVSTEQIDGRTHVDLLTEPTIMRERQ